MADDSPRRGRKKPPLGAGTRGTADIIGSQTQLAPEPHTSPLSTRIRPSTHKRAKLRAIENGEDLQELVERALVRELDESG